MRKSLFLTATLFSGLFTASAAITPYAWYQLGEKDQVLPYGWQLDSTTNNILFGPDAFFDNRVSCIAGAQVITNVAAGGPLGPNHYTSVESLRVHYAPGNGNGGISHAGVPIALGQPYGVWPPTDDATGFITPAGWSWQTNANWVMEAWILPIGNGCRSGDTEGWMLSCGGNNISTSGSEGRTNWGVQVNIVNTNADGTQETGNVYLQCDAYGPTSTAISTASGLPMNVDTNGLPWNYSMAPPILIKTPTDNRWTHIAVVRDSQATPAVPFYAGEKGTVTLYTNGVAAFSTNASRVWQAATLQAPFTPFWNPQPPTMFGKRDQSYARPFNGFMDEVRFSSFLPGQFSTNDLLLRSIPGPGIVKQPVNATVYAGNAAPFQVIAAFDTTLAYKWWKVVGSTLTTIGSGVIDTNAQLIVPASAYSSGDKFVCAVSNTGGVNPGMVYTTTNTVTTMANPSAIGVYQTAVKAEPSLISYFPGDNDNPLGTTLTDVKAGNNGTLSGNVALDGSITRFAGGQGLTFNRDGEWQFGTNDDVAIPSLPDYDFTTGFGTVEAVLYLDPAALKEPWALNWPWSGYGYTWLSSANLALQPPSSGVGGIESLLLSNNGLACHYVFSADTIGNIIYYAPYNTTALSSPPNGGPGFNNAPIFWPVPGGTVGRTLHVAIVFDNMTNVTCYVNGESLGTKQQLGFGPTNSLPLHIGNATYTVVQQNDTLINGSPSTAQSQGWFPAVWYGSVDELALYRTNLTASQVANHAYKLLNGGTSSPATATMLTPSKSMFAHGTQTFTVVAGGQPPYAYTWMTNGVAVLGATNATMTLQNITSTVTVTCSIQGAFGGPAVSAPCVVSITTPIVGSYADQVMSNAPVAFYRFNETNGTTAYDWAGSHDGSYNGAASTYAKNVTGPALGEGGFRAFGTNAPNSRTEVRVPYAPELNGWASPNNAFTYEVWFKADKANTDQTVFSGRFRRGNNKAGVTILFNDDAEGIANEDTANKNFQYRFGKYFNIQQTSQVNNAPTFIASTNIWHHLVITFDGAIGADGNGIRGNRHVYYDGSVWQSDLVTCNKGDLLNGSGQGDFQLNQFAALIVGNCPDYENTVNQNRPIAGTVSDLAVYSYALSSNQVVGHYSAYFTAATNQVNPVGVTTNESYQTSITLTAVVSGNGNSYQWYLVNGSGSNALVGTTLNLDGTPHYPAIFNGVYDLQGVDSPVLVINELTPADAGQYVLVTFNNLNPGGSISTLPATVAVTPDLTAPRATGAAGLGQFIVGSRTATAPPPAPVAVQVQFTKRMDPTTATTLANYSIDGGVTILGAYLSASPGDTRFGGNYMSVTLQTSDLTPGQNYTLTVSGIKDQTYTGNTAPPATLYFTAPVLKSGLVWDYYAAVPGGMSALTSGNYNNTGLEFATQPYFPAGTNSFPFVPQYETTLTNFDTTQLNNGGTGIGCNPIFGTGTAGSGEGANYGALISGWLTPTREDDYTFFLIDDDAAALYISTDSSSPYDSVMIAQGTGVNNSFVEPPTPWFAGPTSLPTHLLAGHSYYIEVIHYQAGGNDRAAVAWRSASGPDSLTPAANLQPIPGALLSSYGRPATPVLTATVSGGTVTVSWTGAGRLMQSSNASLPFSQWTPVPGNPASSYHVTPGANPQTFYRLVQ